MSDDGADLGVKPHRALKTVLGGEAQPSDDEKMDPVAFEKWIMSQTIEGATDYDGVGAFAAKAVLVHLRAHPEDITLDERGLYDKMPREVRDLGLTGFMWGWAMNAARRCLEMPSVPNPAILRIGERDDAGATRP